MRQASVWQLTPRCSAHMRPMPCQDDDGDDADDAWLLQQGGAGAGAGADASFSGSPGKAGYQFSSQRRKLVNTSLEAYKMLVGGGRGGVGWGGVGRVGGWVVGAASQQAPLPASDPTALCPPTCPPPADAPQVAFIVWAATVLVVYGVSIVLLRASIKPVADLAAAQARGRCGKPGCRLDGRGARLQNRPCIPPFTLTLHAPASSVLQKLHYLTSRLLYTTQKLSVVATQAESDALVPQ